MSASVIVVKHYGGSVRVFGPFLSEQRRDEAETRIDEATDTQVGAGEVEVCTVLLEGFPTKAILNELREGWG